MAKKQLNSPTKARLLLVLSISIVSIAIVYFTRPVSKKEYMPKFHAGECMEAPSNCESWETGLSCSRYISLILEIGKFKYRTLYTDANFGDEGGHVPYSEPIALADSFSDKVDCTKHLKEKYDEFRRTKEVH